MFIAGSCCEGLKPLFTGLLIGGLAVSFCACAGMPSAVRAPEGGQALRVVLTGGTHGTMEPSGCGCRQRGGLARRAALVSELKSGMPAALVLDGGNTLVEKQPPELADLPARADYMLGALEYMQTDAFNIGASDCALGSAYLTAKQPKTRVPFVSANIYSAETGQPCFQPYIIRTVQGMRVGLFGLADDRRPAGLSTAGLVIGDPLAAAGQTVARLQEADCALIILLSQLSRETSLRIARSTPGIDFILDRGAGALASEPISEGGAVLLSAGESGTHVAVIDLELKDADEPLVRQGRLAELRQEIAQLDLRAQPPAGSAEAERLAVRRGRLEEQLAAAEGKNTYRVRRVPLDATVQEDPQVRLLVEKYKTGHAREQLSAAGAAYESRVPTVDLAGLTELQQLIAMRLMNGIECDPAGSVAAQAPRKLFCRDLARMIVERVRQGETEGRIRYEVLHAQEKQAALEKRSVLR